MAPAEFDAFAANYDAELERGLALTGEGKTYYARRRLTWLRRRLGGRPANRVLDFGCGTGTAAPLLVELLGAKEVLGVDPSAESLARARAEHGGPGIQFATPDEYRPDRRFDLVFTNGVLHHVPPAQRAGVIRYVAGALRPGGRFACWENTPWNPGTRLIMRRVAFDRDAVLLRPAELRGLARGAGLQVESTDFLFVFPRSLAPLRGLERWLVRLPLGGQYLVLARKPASP